MRPGRRVRRGARPHPDERPLREREPDAATPTAPSPTSRTCPATSPSAGAASGTRCRRRTRRRSSGTCSALLGLALVGRRLGGPRLAATLAFAWVAWPFTQYASSSNTNDLIQPALLIWGFYFASSPVAARRRSSRSRSWVKFAPLLLVPLWSGFPETRAPAAAPASSSRGFAIATALCVLGAAARAVAVARGAGLLRSHDPTGRSAASRRSRSGTGGSTTRRASPTCTSSSVVLEVLLVARRARALALAAPSLAAPARGVHGRGADRLRARADALVLPLPAVVLPVRRDRAALRAPAAGAGRGGGR